MKRVILSATLVAFLTLAVFSSQSQSTEAQQTKDFQLTVRNITARQPISPPIVVVHDSSAVLLPSSAGRLEGLEAFAESGSQPELMESLRGRSGVKDVLRFGGVLNPNSQQTLLRVPAEPGDYISVLGSLQCTNDGITLGTIIVSDDGSPSYGSGTVWDAGTEIMTNRAPRYRVWTERGLLILIPRTVKEVSAVIRVFPALLTSVQYLTGSTLSSRYLWMSAVLGPARAFEVGATLENQTTGQPIMPPVVVVHDKNVDVIEYTRPKELPGIDALSESGDGSVLIATLAERPGVVSVRQWWTDGPDCTGRFFRR